MEVLSRVLHAEMQPSMFANELVRYIRLGCAVQSSGGADVSLSLHHAKHGPYSHGDCTGSTLGGHSMSPTAGKLCAGAAEGGRAVGGKVRAGAGSARKLSARRFLHRSGRAAGSPRQQWAGALPEGQDPCAAEQCEAGS